MYACTRVHMPRCLATAIRFSPFNLEKGIKDQLISRQFPSWKVCRLRVGRLSSPPLKPLFQAASDAPSCEWSGPCSVLVSVLVLGLWCLVPALLVCFKSGVRVSTGGGMVLQARPVPGHGHDI